MNELITITTGGHGSPVVSARELYGFLGFNKAAFARWAKKNIEQNTFAREGEDWEGFNMMLTSNEVKDYALTLDFAKRLSMTARTEKGEQARRYFLECEKRLLQPVVLTPAQQLLQQAQLLVRHEERLTGLEQRVQVLESLNAGRKFPLGLSSTNQTATQTTRTKVAQLVNQYAEASNTAYYMVWTKLYNRLHVVYGFNVRAQRKTTYENLLDVIERCGYIERLYAIVRSELSHKEG